jgi:hypothetical protein
MTQGRGKQVAEWWVLSGLLALIAYSGLTRAPIPT